MRSARPIGKPRQGAGRCPRAAPGGSWSPPSTPSCALRGQGCDAEGLRPPGKAWMGLRGDGDGLGQKTWEEMNRPLGAGGAVGERGAGEGPCRCGDPREVVRLQLAVGVEGERETPFARSYPVRSAERKQTSLLERSSAAGPEGWRGGWGVSPPALVRGTARSPHARPCCALCRCKPSRRLRKRKLQMHSSSASSDVLALAAHPGTHQPTRGCSQGSHRSFWLPRAPPVLPRWAGAACRQNAARGLCCHQRPQTAELLPCDVPLACTQITQLPGRQLR